jgi:hypothetical protein
LEEAFFCRQNGVATLSQPGKRNPTIVAAATYRNLSFDRRNPDNKRRRTEARRPSL